MGLIEILLIIIGILAFVASFVIPEKMSKAVNITIPEEKINQLIEEQVKNAEFKIDEKVDETISAAAEKTERYMERMSNEKIMAIQEFSDTVLGQINKNHEESVFLYDMLNNKYAQVKNTTAEINARVQELKNDNVSDTEVVAETVVDSVETADAGSKAAESGAEDRAKVKRPATKRKPPVKKTAIKNSGSNNTKAVEAIPNIEIQFDAESNMGSNKEKILSLHNEGKSNMAIAKSLGLGIGEVKLIIDLFESGE